MRGVYLGTPCLPSWNAYICLSARYSMYSNVSDMAVKNRSERFRTGVVGGADWNDLGKRGEMAKNGIWRLSHPGESSLGGRVSTACTGRESAKMRIGCAIATAKRWTSANNHFGATFRNWV